MYLLHILSLAEGELITPQSIPLTPETPEDPPPPYPCEGAEDDDDECSIDIGSGISEGESPDDNVLLTIPTSPPYFPELHHRPPTTTKSPKTTRLPAVVYEVPIPGISPKDHQRPTQRTRSSADNTALVIGVIAGALIAIVLIALVVYKLRNRTEGSYKVDESKNYQFGAIAASPAFLNGPYHHGPLLPPPHVNGGIGGGKGHPEKTPKKKKGGKDLKEWYV